MQVDPIKPTVKAPGSERLNLTLKKMLSSLAFKINVRLYNKEGLGWEEAWDISSRVFAYTNHTILPEAGAYTRSR